METLTYPACTVHKLGSTTLSHVAFPSQGNLNFPLQKSQWDNKVVKIVWNFFFFKAATINHYIITLLPYSLYNTFVFLPLVFRLSHIHIRWIGWGLLCIQWSLCMLNRWRWDKRWQVFRSVDSEELRRTITLPWAGVELQLNEFTGLQCSGINHTAIFICCLYFFGSAVQFF